MADGDGNDNGGGDAAAAAAAAAALTGGDQSGGDNGGGGDADWRDGLPEDLRGEDMFANYKTLGDFAKGHIETKKLASSKIAMPGDDDASRNAYMDAVRIEKAEDYEIDVPDGMPQEFADGFRAKSHEIALFPWQVKELAAWNNEYNAGVLAAEAKASGDEVADFEKNYSGDFKAALARTQNMLKTSGVELSDDDMASLDKKLGSANLLKAMFFFSDAIGDPDFRGDDDLGGGDDIVKAEQADAKLTEKMQSKEWRAEAQKKDTPERKEFERLTRMATANRVKQNQ